MEHMKYGVTRVWFQFTKNNVKNSVYGKRYTSCDPRVIPGLREGLLKTLT